MYPTVLFLALALSWAGVYGVSAIVAMYAGQPRRPRQPPPATSAEVPQRRVEDTPPVAPVEQDATAA